MTANAVLGVFVLPAVFFTLVEPITVVRDLQGQRLGDRVAQTQVVEGFGARDLAASFQRWWLSFVADLNPILRRPGREPAEVER
jgi:hypothetical protein